MGRESHRITFAKRRCHKCGAEVGMNNWTKHVGSAKCRKAEVRRVQKEAANG